MKLPNFIDFIPFNSLRELMKAPLPDTFELGLTTLEIEVMGKKGLDVSSNDIKELNDGTLAYKNSRVLVYIRDVANYGGSFDSLPRFHIANCSTLKKMKQNKRFDKYVVSIRKDGKFDIIFINNYGDHRAETKELKVCKNCLSHISYNGYSHSGTSFNDEIFNNFSVDEFFKKYPRSVLTTTPVYNSANAPLNDYMTGFKEESTAYRTSMNWSCQHCKVDLSDSFHRKYLHTHHINGLKYDNNWNNFSALCIKCHAEEPMSAHLKNSPDYKEFLGIYPFVLKKQQN